MLEHDFLQEESEKERNYPNGSSRVGKYNVLVAQNFLTQQLNNGAGIGFALAFGPAVETRPAYIMQYDDLCCCETSLVANPIPLARANGAVEFHCGAALFPRR